MVELLKVIGHQSINQYSYQLLIIININISMRELFSVTRFCTYYITVHLHLTVPKVQCDYANNSLMSFLQNESICEHNSAA